MRKSPRYLAWAAVGKESGKVLRNGYGKYAINTHRAGALADCPTYGEVRRVEIRVTERDAELKRGRAG